MFGKKHSILCKILQASVFLVPLLFFLSYLSNSGFSIRESKTFVISEKLRKNSNIKYILQWTESNTEPFDTMGVGRSEFIRRKCEYTNCFVTDNKYYLENYTVFDAIVFAWPQLRTKEKTELPQKRSPSQKYVFASIESPIYYPICNDFYNGYFNWTWTYKLDSDSRWRYLDVWDANGTMIGPKKNMHWMKVEDMDPVSDELKHILRKKTKTAAWFVSNCPSKSKRQKFVENLQKELRKYDLDVDIYGKCGTLQCPRSNYAACYQMLEENYHFYLSFENSFAADYVTEKLLTALQHNTIPIVYGGANYTRFMPDGTYLNARTLGVEKLAKMMHHLIMNPDEYMDYFRWKNHYSYDRRFESPRTDNICSICGLLNDVHQVGSESIREDLREWWTPPGAC